MHLKLLTTIILFFLSFQSAFSNETILPIKKPDLNEKNTTKKIAEIIPLPKPSEKKDEIQKEIKITTTEIFKKIDGVIIPKNKPLIVKEKLRKIKKHTKNLANSLTNILKIIIITILKIELIIFVHYHLKKYHMVTSKIECGILLQVNF